MKPLVLASGLLATLLVLGVRTGQADTIVLPGTAAHMIQVDDDDEDRGDGDRWLPFWFGLRAFVPQRQVIVEHQYYYGPYAPPPPPAYAPPPQTYWYYCRDPEGYYPNVRRCPEGWMRVVPGGPDAR